LIKQKVKNKISNLSLTYRLSYLEEIESEAIYVIREAYAQFENPCILFSGRKVLFNQLF
jgi:3'-phosphoadenosine 5'-phosphosulfate sulfotransferase (PAPS reductase)/FAD synthetase